MSIASHFNLMGVLGALARISTDMVNTSQLCHSTATSKLAPDQIQHKNDIRHFRSTQYEKSFHQKVIQSVFNAQLQPNWHNHNLSKSPIRKLLRMFQKKPYPS